MKKHKKAALKLIVLAALLTLVTSLCGCVRYKTTIDVNADGTADVSMMVAFADSITDYLGEEESEDSEDEESEFEEDGWAYTEYKHDDYTGYVVSKSGIDLEDLEDVISELNESDGFKVTIDGNKYRFEWDMSSDDETEEVDPEYLAMYDGYMELVIKLPVKALDSNATDESNDGKTLKWDLTEIEDDTIYVEFKLNDGLSVIVIILIVVAAVILLAVLIILAIFLRKKKKVAPVSDERVAVPDNYENGVSAYNIEQNIESAHQPEQTQAPEDANQSE